MQIGNFLQYDNIDALGNTLTYSDPCKFNAKFKGSNCFYSNTTANYITLGNKANFSDVTAIEVDLMFSQLQLGSTNYIFTNIINGLGFCFATSSSTGETYANAYLSSTKQWRFTLPVLTINTHYKIRVELLNNVCNLYIDDQICSSTTSTYTSSLLDIVYIGNNSAKKWPLHNTSIWNFRCYNANGDLVHHYPMSEGMGKIIYDTVGDKHGVIINAGNIYTVVWSKFQDDYHYNLTEGYISIDGDDIDRFSKTLKIPLKDASSVLVAKDSYQAGINNYTVMAEAEGGGWTTYDSSTVTLVKDNTNGNYIKVQVTNGTVSTLKTLNNCTLMNEFNGSLPTTFTSPNLPASYNNFINVNPQIPVQYNLKCKVRCNVHTYDGVDQDTLSFRFYMLHGGTNSFTANMNPPNDGEWHDIDITGSVNPNGAYISAGTGRQFCYLQIRNVTANVSVNIDLDIKDIELYRISNCTYHPPILNGHNGAETLLDFTQQGSTNVAEIQKPILANYRYGLIQSTDRSMGANGSMRANGWEGAMAAASQTARTTITNGVWAVIYNPVSVGNTTCGYIDNYELTAEELAMMGLSSTGVKANAVQFTSGTNSIIGSAIQNCGLYYRIQYSTLLGYNSSNVLINKSIYNQQYNVHFTGWMKRLTEYPVTNCCLGLTYCYITAIDNTDFTDIVNADNNWHYVDIMLPLNTCVHQNGSNNKLFGITCSPTGYTSYINPDTGVAYTAAEATHRPCLALADVKIVIEPAEVYNKDGSNFKLYNLNINQWSEPQYKRIENQINFKL